MDYLEQVAKTGAYRFRRGIPEHLRPYFPERGTVWSEHLDTKIETDARPRCLEIAAKVERLFQQAQSRYDAERRHGHATHSALRLEAVTRIVADWKAAERSRRAQFVLLRPVMGGWSEFLQEARLLGICGQSPREETTPERIARARAEQSFIDGVIRETPEAGGVLVTLDHPAYPVFSKLFRQAWSEVLEAEHRWRANDYADLPLGNMQPVTSPPVAAATAIQPSNQARAASAGPMGDPLFSIALEEWVRLGKPAARTQIEARTALRQFTELHSHLTIRSTTKQHTRAYRDALAQNAFEKGLRGHGHRRMRVADAAMMMSRFGDGGELFVVADEATVLDDPGERAFDHPASRQDLEALGGGVAA